MSLGRPALRRERALLLGFAIVPLEEPECGDALERSGCEGCVDEGSLDRVADEEEPCDGREGVITGEAAAVDRGLFRGGRKFSNAQRLFDALGGEVSAFEHSAQVCQRFPLDDWRC